MCDEHTEIDKDEFVRAGGQLNRRNFSKLTTIAAFSALLPLTACSSTPSSEIVEKEVEVPMSNGASDSYFVHPASGTYPGILMWPDIKGLRPAFKAMGKRLAQSGYAVLVVNPFYRDAKAPVLEPGANFRDPETWAFLRGMAGKLGQDNAMSDARDYIAFLDGQSAVNTNKGIGTAGYCMGGPLIMRTAGALPERVKAAASFHGGGLATDKPDSPHLLIPKTTAQVLHAVAENDDARSPDVKNILKKAYEDAGIPAEIEVYAGTQHGWCPPDSQVYDEAMAEKAWSRMLALFERAL